MSTPGSGRGWARRNNCRRCRRIPTHRFNLHAGQNAPGPWPRSPPRRSRTWRRRHSCNRPARLQAKGGGCQEPGQQRMRSPCSGGWCVGVWMWEGMVHARSAGPGHALRPACRAGRGTGHGMHAAAAAPPLTCLVAQHALHDLQHDHRKGAPEQQRQQATATKPKHRVSNPVSISCVVEGSGRQAGAGLLKKRRPAHRSRQPWQQAGPATIAVLHTDRERQQQQRQQDGGDATHQSQRATGKRRWCGRRRTGWRSCCQSRP